MRRFALLCLFAVLPAFSAVETTTVNGKVVLSDGSAATAGAITCTLSAPGTALDGSTSQRVAGSDTATIGSDGTVTGLTLVPNDAITPAGTTYKCAFNVSAPRRVSWDETWSVATSPDPVNIGSITRYNVAPGITAGSFLLYVTSEPSGSCTSGEAPRQATATGKTCTCSAGTWSCIGGGASPAGSSTELQYRNGSSLGATDTTFTAATSTEPSITRHAGTVKLQNGWDATGDSQGMQFYPSRKRSASMAIAAKKRGDTKFASPTTNPVVIIGDSIMATASQAAWRIWDERFRAWGLGFDPLVDCDIYHGNFTLKTETWGGTWAFRHVGTLGCLTASAPSNATEWGLASQSATADDASDTLYYGWAHPIRANRARIWYAKKPGGGHFEYRANGGSWTDVDTANATLDAGSVTITLSASILLEGVVEVRWASGGSITLWGIETYAADTVGDRIEFQNTLPYWLTAGGQSLAGTATDWESYGNSNTPLQTFLRTVLPSQIIVTLGTNDACLGGLGSSCSGGYVTADDEETALRALVASLSTYMDPANKGDIVLATALPRGTHGSGTESATVGPRLDGYRQRIFEVARDLDLSVWDLRRWWPTFAEADSGALNLYDDGTHPSPTGKALLMRGMTAWLDPDPWKADTTGGLYCGAYSLSSGAVIWPECTFGTINSSGTFHTLSSCDYKHNFGRNVEVFCGSGATWDIDADSTAGNVRAGADFACGTNKAIRLTCDGVNWRETGRSFATTTATTYLCETFGLANPGANTTTYFFASDGGSVYYWAPPYAGTLASMSCVNNAQLSGGSGTITAVRYDGTLDATDLTVTYTTTETAPTKKNDTACTSNCAVAASTDLVAVRIATDVSYAATTADWACTVCMTVP